MPPFFNKLCNLLKKVEILFSKHLISTWHTLIVNIALVVVKSRVSLNPDFILRKDLILMKNVGIGMNLAKLDLLLVAITMNTGTVELVVASTVELLVVAIAMNTGKANELVVAITMNTGTANELLVVTITMNTGTANELVVAIAMNTGKANELVVAMNPGKANELVVVTMIHHSSA
jgi:hypothetical protein